MKMIRVIEAHVFDLIEFDFIVLLSTPIHICTIDSYHILQRNATTYN